MIAKIPEKYDLCISYSWGSNNHGICGHTYEVIDYYYILKNNFNVCILICELNKLQFETAIREKYSFTENEITNIMQNTYFFNKPKILICKNVLFTDGGMHKLKDITIKAINKFMFSCTKYESDFIILEDKRVYKRNNINYVKKILFQKLKQISKSDNRSLLYLTNNCRKIDDAIYNELLQRDEQYICLVNETYEKNNNDKFYYEVVPVKNIFEKFNKYIYTPVQRKWDCSPRFLAECKWYNKDVEFLGINYWKEDLGLYWRWFDIQYNFGSIMLTENDELITILKKYI